MGVDICMGVHDIVCLNWKVWTIRRMHNKGCYEGKDVHRVQFELPLCNGQYS